MTTRWVHPEHMEASVSINARNERMAERADAAADIALLIAAAVCLAVMVWVW